MPARIPPRRGPSRPTATATPTTMTAVATSLKSIGCNMRTSCSGCRESVHAGDRAIPDHLVVGGLNHGGHRLRGHQRPADGVGAAYRAVAKPRQACVLHRMAE